MPAPVRSDDTRGLSRLTLLFWGGVAIAALAALLLLVADGNTALRFAAVLAIGSLVLIGLSITLRPDGSADVRRILGEVEELRAEIAMVARSGEQAAEQAQRTQEAVLALRRRVDDDPPLRARGDQVTSGSGRARVPVPAAADAVPGGASVDEVDPVPRRAADRHRGHEPLADPDEGRRRSAEADGGRRRSAVSEVGRRRRADPEEDRFAGHGDEDVLGPDTPPRPVGVVRHTETVHVTTRHTIVDGSRPEPGPSGVYGSWGRAVPEERPWVGHGPETGERWDDQAPGVDRSRGVGQRDPQRSGRRASDRDERPARGRAYPPNDTEAEYWSDVQAGDRWASVRDDDRGRELRMGERRAAMHADGTGAEFRVEDRWAAVRRGEPGRDSREAFPGDDVSDWPEPGTSPGGPGWSEPRGRAARVAPGRPGPGQPGRREHSGRWSEPEQQHPELPPGGVPVPDAWRPPAAPRGRQPVDEWTPEAYPESRPRRRAPEPYADPRDGPRGPDRWR